MATCLRCATARRVDGELAISWNWRRGSESNAVFTGCQPQYPDLQGNSNPGFTGVQALFDATSQLSGLTRHLPAFYSVIEEIVEGFVEGISSVPSRKRHMRCLIY